MGCIPTSFYFEIPLLVKMQGCNMYPAYYQLVYILVTRGVKREGTVIVLKSDVC